MSDRNNRPSIRLTDEELNALNDLAGERGEQSPFVGGLILAAATYGEGRAAKMMNVEQLTAMLERHNETMTRIEDERRTAHEELLTELRTFDPTAVTEEELAEAVEDSMRVLELRYESRTGNSLRSLRGDTPARMEVDDELVGLLADRHNVPVGTLFDELAERCADDERFCLDRGDDR